MSSQLDLDDVCAGHPLATAELAALRRNSAVSETYYALNFLTSAGTWEQMTALCDSEVEAQEELAGFRQRHPDFQFQLVRWNVVKEVLSDE